MLFQGFVGQRALCWQYPPVLLPMSGRGAGTGFLFCFPFLVVVLAVPLAALFLVLVSVNGASSAPGFLFLAVVLDVFSCVVPPFPAVLGTPAAADDRAGDSRSIWTISPVSLGFCFNSFHTAQFWSDTPAPPSTPQQDLQFSEPQILPY